MTNISDLPASPFGMPMQPGRPANAGPDTVLPLSRERVAQALTRLGIQHGLDEDGDPIAMWETFLVRYICTGNDLEVFQVRAMWAAQPPVEARPQLLEWINDWHATHRWPMAFLAHVEGFNVVFSDVTTDLEFGVTDNQLDQLIRCATGTSSSFFEEIAQAFPQSKDWMPTTDDADNN